MRRTFWSHDRVTMLLALWHAGLSGTPIAQAIGAGCTRAMVIGKLDRMGLIGDMPAAARRERLRNASLRALAGRRPAEQARA